MGSQVNRDAIVYVEPLGMMSHGFSRERATGHKAEGVNEIGELVLAMKLAI
jgi:hypothetical protein